MRSREACLALPTGLSKQTNVSVCAVWDQCDGHILLAAICFIHLYNLEISLSVKHKRRADDRQSETFLQNPSASLSSAQTGARARDVSDR